jgi:hypothetical protein
MKVFIAGIMQGADAGHGIADQSYRLEIQRLVEKHHADCEVFDPQTVMQALLQERLPDLVRMYAAYAADPPAFFAPQAVGPALGELLDVFRSIVKRASQCDLLIAYLPDKTPSMGTAMEMWAAFSSGAKVVAVTELTRNLAILSTATFVVPSLAVLDQLFAEGALR